MAIERDNDTARQSADRATGISENVEFLGDDSVRISSSSTEVNHNADAPSSMAEKLKKLVGRFADQNFWDDPQKNELSTNGHCFGWWQDCLPTASRQ